MKKRYLFQSLFVTGLATMSNVSANTNANINNTDEKGTLSTTQMVDSQKCSRTCNSCCWKGFEVGADFLWWKLCAVDLGYTKFAYFFQIQPSGSGFLVQAHDKVKALETKWEPGVRVRLAKKDLWHGIDLIGSYTYINNHLSAKIDQHPGGILESILLPTTINFTGVPTGASLSSLFTSYKLKYQTFDALFTTNYCFRQRHNFSPFFGVTGLILNQHSEVIAQVSSTSSSEVGKWKDNFFGVGVKLGLDSQWNVWSGLSIYGTGAWMITAGTHHADYSYKANSPGAGNLSYNATVGDNESIFIPGYHIAMGFLYEKCFSCCKLGIKLGYDMLDWQDVPGMRSPLSQFEGVTTLSSPIATNIGFQGLLVGGYLQF